MPTVTSKDGTKIAFEKVGFGPAVILVNGAMSYRRAFDTTLEELADLLSKDFTVYDYDRRGRGESGDTEPFTKVREIEDIQALGEEAGGEAMLAVSRLVGLLHWRPRRSRLASRKRLYTRCHLSSTTVASL